MSGEAKKVGEFGSWESPIVAELITKGARGLSSVKVSGEGKDERVFWLEMRPDEGGRGVVCSQTPGGHIESWTPKGFSARSKVHEYGGGALCVGDGRVFFTNDSDQRLYVQDSPDVAPKALTPANSKCRYADGAFSNGRLFVVEEDHSGVGRDDVKYPINSIVSVETSGAAAEAKPRRVAEGKDFYASPRLSPDGRRLCWLSWSFPHMPWEATEVWVADVDEAGLVSKARKLLGDGRRSYIMPRLATANRLLVSHDGSDWWNVYAVDVESGAELECLDSAEAEVGEPLWQFGYQAFAQEPNGHRVAFFKGSELIVKQEGSALKTLNTGYSAHRFIEFAHGCVYAIAMHPAKATAVIRHRLSDGSTEVVREASDKAPPAQFLSVPQHVTFPTGKDKSAVAHANFYPPANGNFVGPEGARPPLVVMAHGGPTGQASTALDLKKQFYTSRGFAVLDVDYRGSTGYGRAYRDALMGQFGVVDIEDCCEAAAWAAEKGWADASKLCIEGGSSGGYVVLCAILRPRLFSAAVSRYGISDLEELALTTHKFEAPYNDSLLAPYPEGAAVYRERSPIHRAQSITCPVAFFQGLDDKVVPPAQTTKMFQAVKDLGLPTALVEFPGEGHGFRSAENIRLALEGSYYFLCRVLNIPTSLQVPSDRMKILNLP